MENTKSNECPCCRTQTIQDEEMVYCEKCGFNIVDKRDNYPQKDGKTIGIETIN